MLEEIRKKAKEKLEKVNNDPNSTEKDKNYAAHIVEFFSKEEGFKQAPKSLVFSLFVALGYPVDTDVYDEMYDKIIEDIDKVYEYVNLDEIIKR